MEEHADRALGPVEHAGDLRGRHLVDEAKDDGAAPITSVELSADGGRTWSAATLAAEAGPFAFREWSHAMNLPSGRCELWCRAVDAFGRTQPIDGTLFWNPGGYCWSGVERIVQRIRRHFAPLPEAVAHG